MTSKDGKIYYFDHAAATPLEPVVLEAMLPFLRYEYANPSSLYSAARHTRAAIEHSRAKIAALIGAKPTEIVFTSGGTESNNLAIQGVLRANPGSHWVTTAIEHDAVLQNAKHQSRFGHDVTVVAVGEAGIVDSKAMAGSIRDDTVLVSVMYANNEIGTIQPVGDIVRRVKAIRAQRRASGNLLPLYVHTDAVQAAQYLSLHVDRLGIDLMSINGSKLYGPKGTGVLYLRHTTSIEPLMYGGGQERERRSGTENVGGIVGLANAMEIADSIRESEAARLAALRDNLLARLRVKLPDLIVNGDTKRRLPNNLNITIPGADGESLILYLDGRGFLASTGSACSTGNLDPSHVLLAIGRSPQQANCSVRLSLGRATDATAIKALSNALPEVVSRVLQLGQLN